MHLHIPYGLTDVHVATTKTVSPALLDCKNLDSQVWLFKKQLHTWQWEIQRLISIKMIIEPSWWYLIFRQKNQVILNKNVLVLQFTNCPICVLHNFLEQTWHQMLCVTVGQAWGFHGNDCFQYSLPWFRLNQTFSQTGVQASNLGYKPGLNGTVDIFSLADQNLFDKSCFSQKVEKFLWLAPLSHNYESKTLFHFTCSPSCINHKVHRQVCTVQSGADLGWGWTSDRVY